MNKSVLGFVLLLILTFFLEGSYAVTGGINPDLEDVAKYKPITTTSDEKACGYPTTDTFCAAAENDEGIRNNACDVKTCNQKCPGREKEDGSETRFINMLGGDTGPCVLPDYVDSRVPRIPSFKFFNDPECGMIPGKVPRVGQSGQFTLTAWLKQEPGNAGVIFEKVGGPGRRKQVVLTVMVGAYSIVLQHRGADGRTHFKAIRAPFPSGRWTHLAIQVFSRDISIFINGPGPDGTPFAVAKLDVEIADLDSPTSRIGQRVQESDLALNSTSEFASQIQQEVPEYSNSTQQYVGRIQDYHWYDQVLTNREIQEIATGVFPETNIQSNCICPLGVPRVHPLEERYCIPNGVPDTAVQLRRLRLNQNAHPLAYINDGDSSTTWISQQKIYMKEGTTITIDLQDEYEVFYVTLQFYNSQPLSITIARNSSATNGEMENWVCFADECESRCKLPENEELEEPDSLNCEAFEDVPYRNGNVTFTLLGLEPSRRPGANNFYRTPKLMNFVKATKVKFSFSYMYYTDPPDVNSHHVYYGLRGIQIIGRCNCHGHARECNTESNPYKCGCLPESNTEGNMCERCKPLYNNKEFKIGDTRSPYNCQQCNCNQHADSCHYNRSVDPNPDDFFVGGGGVCDNCQHRTTGRHCERCAPFFFRKPEKQLNVPDVCNPCNCHGGGVVNGSKHCEQIGGQCSCKEMVTSRRCSKCIDGYYNLRRDNEQGCEECSCDLSGTVNRTFTCRQGNGQCDCRNNVRGRTCSLCQYGFKNLTDSNPDGCESCNCNTVGSTDQYCNSNNGQCHCRDQVQGMLCDECEDGFWGLSETGCRPCGCDVAGSEPGTNCDKDTGQCVCKANTQGRTCNECVDKYYNLIETNLQGCESCGCDARGTLNASLVCEKSTGQCDCKVNVDGRVCNLCKGNTFGLSENLDLGCEACNCDPMGTSLGQQLAPHELVCDSNSGQCACLPSREGRRCDQCSPGFYLPLSNETGCLVCDCHPVGSTSQVCNNVTGMCPCKPEETGAGLTGRRCDECQRTFWNFNALFGSCERCECDEAGSEHGECNIVTGQCRCKGNVIGRQCDTCRPGSSDLRSQNPMGCYSHPEQQAAPMETEVTSRWISLTWNPPDHPNGDDLLYELYRNRELIYTINDTSPFGSYPFNDTGLLPYTNYDYYIETSNIGGSVLSPDLRVRTLAGIPTGVPPIRVSNVRAHHATFEWEAPKIAHGPIEAYVLQSVTTEVDDIFEVHYRGIDTSVTADSLLAFTNYTFTLRACTSGGCGDSLPLNVITPEAKPAEQRPPTVVATSNTTLEISWKPPDEASGIIIQYELMMRGKPGSDGVHRPLQRVVFQSHGAYNPRPVPSHHHSSLNPPNSNFTQEGLQPFTQYEFLVSSANSLGSVESPWTTARTLEGTPVFMPPPRLDPISSFEMNITWEIPHPVTEVRGDVMMYQVILTRNNTSGNPYAPPTEDVVIYSCGPSVTHFVATGFEPYSTHMITMRLCNSVSCILSTASNATTLPAAPQGQPPPIAKRRNGSIDLSWSDPERINGPRPNFMLLRSQVSFSSPSIEMSRGIRFPGLSYVRFPPSVLPRDASYSGIEMKFRTFEANSLLFFAASPKSSGLREEYIVLQILDGRPWFLFDAQNNPTAVTTSNDDGRRYDDGEWHRIEANRFNRDGYIEVDGIYTGSKKSKGDSTVIGINDGVFVGGIPSDFAVARPDDEGNHVIVTQGHVGCIKDLRVQRDVALGHWTNVTWEEADRLHRAYSPWQGCPFYLDRPSAHFLGRGNLEMSKTLGALGSTSWSIKLKLRTEYSSGILFYASGMNQEYMIATINDRKIRYLVSTSKDYVIEVDVTPNNVTIISSVCDGDWHDLTFQNMRSRIFVEIDGNRGNSADFRHSRNLMNFNLNGHLYFGGIPTNILNNLVTVLDDDAKSFGGCMRDFTIDGRSIDFTRDAKSAINVDLDGCPRGASNSPSSSVPFHLSGDGSGDVFEATFSTPYNVSVLRNNATCMESRIDVLYTGLNNSFQDESIGEEAFTRYLYKVTSSNAGGESQSEWMITRSGEGVPQTVPAPFNERSKSGREVELEWRRPIKAKGVITNYTLSAMRMNTDDKNATNFTSSVNHDDVGVTNATYAGDVLIGSINGLKPWTNYSVTLSACTVRGCSRSAGSIKVTTLEETPEGVRAPTADVNATSMTIRWKEPEAPNGPIMSYTLYHNKSDIYEGVDTHFHISGLPIFTAQIFKLEACTTAGCNTSDDVTLYSGQLPPGHVDQPMVTVRGPHTVEIRWLEPAIMNGILERYVIYLRDPTSEIGSHGRVVHNTTDRMLLHSMNNLVAGTQYYVTLSACTRGGCKFSSPAPCQTTESVPEGVPPPEVVSPDPHSFIVSWTQPELPNGVVTLYSLYQNNVLVHNSTKPSQTIVDRLSPWSRHTFRVRVCTKKGCSFGPAVSLRTQESPPTGRVKLSVTVLGPKTLEARWGEPGRQNGRMHYSIVCVGLFYVNPDDNNYSTMKESRVMLDTTATHEWMRVEGLIPYTDYIVKVNSSNGAGYVISNMRTVSMPPGAPDGVMIPTLASHGPTSILASWSDPSRNNAPGNSLFQLEYRSVFPPENEISIFDSITRQMSYNLTGLKPYKEYEFQIIASNEFGSTPSGWASRYTMQDKPSSIDPPIVYAADAWSLHVTWEVPSSSNGIIEAYNLYENRMLRIVLPGNVTSFRADFLTPFTTYIYRIEVCTAAGCTSSGMSRAVRTNAHAPEGVYPPILRSDTPASVFVTWKAPEFSHGILDNYRLERRLNGSDDANPILLGVIAPSQSLRYLDEGDDLRPYEAYQYRVISATLEGGSATSGWSTVRTRPGRPGGILAPRVTVTGSESAQVEWESPIQRNGPIINYEILFPEPRIRVNKVTMRQKYVTDLIPFTYYQVSITACTTGGCTESPSTHVRTLPAVPRGLDPPIATPITERYVNVQWNPPNFPNGPGIYYELSRTILFQPLLLRPPPSINISQNIYSGTALLYEDRSLQKYMACEYRLSVFNSVGSLASNGTIVTTLAGYPTSNGELNVAVHNHTSVYLWWEPPSMRELQGEVHRFKIRYNSTHRGGGEKTFPPDVTSWNLNLLHPGTLYQFELDIDNGAHIVTSSPVYATTDDGAPIGVSPPVVYSLSPSQLRVSWLQPSQPNGRIITYNIIIDDVTINTNMTEASAFVIDNLRPYTIYTLKIEVCTVYACAVSNQTWATTQETNPTGLTAPQLQMSGGRSVVISWKAPALLNGILKNYRIQRRKLIPCGDMNDTSNDVTIRNSEINERICIYVKCDRGDRLCGSTCYNPTRQVCCDGLLHQVNEAKECCGKNYVSVRGRPSDVCCGGRFHSFIENHECCGDRYLRVNAREVCCKDPIEDRISVGVGDSCCGGVPYFDNGLQLCCDQILYDGFNRKCCGGEIILSEKICCGNSTEGTHYDADSNYNCCGTKYQPVNTTICCHGNNEYKTHTVDNVTSSNKKCCSSELITSDQLCCNGIGYDLDSNVCADVATTSLSDMTMPLNCGMGTLCPLRQSMFAACDRCDFDRENFDCFRSSITSNTSSEGGNDDMCPTLFFTVYSGPPNIFSFHDNNLVPYTSYQYKIVAENKVGSGESDISDVTTPQAPPDDVYAPDWTSQDRDTIILTWKPPGRQNGVITRYALMRDGMELWNGLALRHTDSFQILSYREYEYVLRVCTRSGCTNSSPIRATSVQGIPQFVTPPGLVVTGSRTILLTWTPPARSNGLLQIYVINETSVGTIHVMTPPSMSPDELRYEHSNLKAYTSHTYTLTACTRVGCTDSDEVTATTNEESPTGVWHRSASLPIDSTTIELFWLKPREPNGVIREYRLLRRITGNTGRRPIPPELLARIQWELIYGGGPNVYKYIDTLDQPGARLQYQLIAFNGAGFGVSDIHEAQLPLEIPPDVPTVQVQALSPTTVKVDWNFDDVTDDVRNYVYQVVLQRDRGGMQTGTTTVETPRRNKREVNEESDHDEFTEDSDEIIQFIPSDHNHSHVIEGLTPFTLYHVRIRTCLNMTSQNNTLFNDFNQTINCNVGFADTTRTLTAPPSGLSKPKVKSTGPRTIDVTWEPPAHANGIITGYQIYRRLAAPRDDAVVYEKMVHVTTDENARSYSDTGGEILPYTKYQYQIRVSNDESMTMSDWADVTTQQDVPTGLTAPNLEAVSAFAVRARWVEPRSPNGVLTNYRLEFQERLLNPTILPPIFTAITAPSTVLDATFSGLRPFAKYRVRIVAVNQALLEGRSEWSHVTTLPAPPSEVTNPTAVAIIDGTSLLITWDEPTVPNGKVEIYNIYEVGFEETPIYSGLSRRFLFRRLTPFTEYHLVLEACTGRELCSRSPPTTFRTAETIPESQPSPIVSYSNATAIMVSWTKPSRANGRLISYHVIRQVIPRPNHRHSVQKRSLYSSDSLSSLRTGSRSSWSPRVVEIDPWSYGDIIQTRVRRQIDDNDVIDDGAVIYEVIDPQNDAYNYSDSELNPYTKYGYKIRTRTNAGYVDSDWVYTETHQAPPEGLRPPEVTLPSDKSPTSLIVTWQLPERINGELQTFRVQRNETPPLSFPISQFRFVDDGLLPYTNYGYTVIACTGGGCVTSDVTTMRTYEEAPLFVATPLVAGLNSSAIEASWELPQTANGIINQYRLRVDGNVRYEGLGRMTVIGGLKPYTSYDVSVEACTNSGCRESENAEVRTLEAPPTDMHSPELHVTSPNSIEVIWEEPDNPNGAITRYEVRRNNELIFVNDGEATRYHDFGLQAGTEYTYVITTCNNRGNVRSEPPVSETTHPSAPSGLEPPSLTATSSSSVRAQWDLPINPNGVVVNYTLFVRHVTKKDQKSYDFIGSVFSFNVRGLEFFEEYLFWTRACTQLGCAMSERALQRTMEAPPANQISPSVVLLYPDQVTLSITWSPPRDRNGVIKGYKLKRRRIIRTSLMSEALESKVIANLTDHSYSDFDLSPYTQFQYQVIAINGAGQAPSPWSSIVRSGEAPPVGVQAPSFYDVKSHSVHVTSDEPEVANGMIRFYHVYMKRNNSKEIMKKVSSGIGRDQTILNLHPYITYKFVIEACTFEPMCTKGPPGYVTTLPAPPSGQEPPEVITVNSNNLTLTWSSPEQPNGEIKRYELHVRKTCPSPHQPFPQECAVGSTHVAYSGQGHVKVVGDLLPFTRYTFRVTSYNEYGRSESDWETAITAKSDPLYIAPFTATSNISTINIRWPNSFILNSVLLRYELSDRGENIYAGFNKFYHLRRTASQVHEFKVSLHTDTGLAETPVLIYDTTNGGVGNGVLVPSQGDSSSDQPGISLAQIPFHQSLWFILTIALIVVIIIVTILVVIIRRMGARPSYERQRSPLKPPQSGRRHGDSVMGMTTLPPYTSDGSLHNYSVQSYPIKSHDILESGRMNRSFSADSLNRSNNRLIGQDISFDHSMFTRNDDVMRYGDQWERVSSYDDDAIVRNRRFHDKSQRAEDDIKVSNKRVDFAVNDVTNRRHNEKRNRVVEEKSLYDRGRQRAVSTFLRFDDIDDVSLDDVASDVMLTHASAKQRELPMHYSKHRPARTNLYVDVPRNTRDPPMPITFYNRQDGPYTVI